VRLKNFYRHGETLADGKLSAELVHKINKVHDFMRGFLGDGKNERL
jgi:hypothetical protein